jgi:hypothetical protein
VGASPWGFESLQPHLIKAVDVHNRGTVAQALTLQRQGLGARRIARQMNLPLPTVKDWLAGKLPRHSRVPMSQLEASPPCEKCGSDIHSFGELPSTYVYLLGLYLGDGSIASHPRGVYKLRISLDVKYPGIIDSAANAAQAIRGRSPFIQRTGNRGCADVSSYWKSWPCLLPQHGPGKKHERPIVLTDWQLELVERWPDQLLRGLIHSDGCRFLNTGRRDWVWPRYSFTQTSDDIREIFCLACRVMGIHWTRAGRTIYVSRKADVARLDEFIGPKH